MDTGAIDAGRDAAMDSGRPRDSSMDATRDGGTDSDVDGNAGDGSLLDGQLLDAQLFDASTMDGAVPDASIFDAGMDAALPPQQAIVALRATQNGEVDMWVDGAWITYVRPAIGDDPAGFFVQAYRTGPALFVVVDPTSLSPMPAVGDAVRFRAIAVQTFRGQHRVTEIENFERLSTGNSIRTLSQEVSNSTDLVSSVDAYESELLTLTATVASAFSSTGVGHLSAALRTSGVSNNPNLIFRAAESVVNALRIENGCVLSIGPTPLWRYTPDANSPTRVQVSAWKNDDVRLLTCPALRVLGAVPRSDTQVLVTFSVQVDEASLAGASAEFEPALSASALSFGSGGLSITTSSMMPDTEYRITLSGLRDIRGNVISALNGTATFRSPGLPITPTSAGQLVISELMPNPSSTDTDMEWFEIYNPTTSTTFNLSGCLIQSNSDTDHSIAGNVIIPPGSYVAMAQSMSAALGFTPAYAYSGITMINSNTGDRIALRCGNQVIDTVTYTPGANGWGSTSTFDAKSLQLSSDRLSAVDNDNGSYWCSGSSVYAMPTGSTTNLGTPGAANRSCQ